MHTNTKKASASTEKNWERLLKDTKESNRQVSKDKTSQWIFLQEIFRFGLRWERGWERKTRSHLLLGCCNDCRHGSLEGKGWNNV